MAWNNLSAGENEFGFVFRYSDDNNFLYASVAHRTSPALTVRVEIVKVEAGSKTTLHLEDISAPALGSNTWGELNLLVVGDEISFRVQIGTIDETFEVTEDFNNTAVLHGLYADRPNSGAFGYAIFDNLEFRETNIQNEKQSVWVNAQGGSLTLTRPETGAPTSGIAHDSSAASVRTRLESIYGVGNVSVTGAGTAGDPWIVEFIGDLAATNLQQMTGNGTNLLAVVVATITEIQDGSPPLDTIWDITIHNTTSGDFQFEFKGRPTSDITYGAVAATVLAALEALAPGDFSGLWTVVDTGIGSADYRITASGRLAGEPQVLIAHNEDLVGTALGITHTTIQQATGRNWIDNPVNYRDVATGLPGLPESGDELFVQTGDETSSLRYGSLAGRQLKRFILGSLFSGHIGLPEVNPAGYAEYRPTHITLEFEAGTQSPDNPNVLIGVEQGQGSGLVRIKTGTDEVHIRVERTGGPAEDARPSFCWDGQNVANTLNLIEGFVGTAVFAFTAANLEHVTQRGGLLRFGEGTAIGTGGFDHTAGETLGRATIGGASVIFGN